MKILHGTWIPQSTDEFIQKGSFYLWGETSTPKKSRTTADNYHPFQLSKEELTSFLTGELGIVQSNYNPLSRQFVPRYFLLPSQDNQPVPSLELLRYLEKEPPENSQWQSWQIDCYPLNPVLKLLNDLHFICLYNSSEIQLGADLLFWYHYSQAFKEIILKDNYIPAFKYRELATNNQKTTNFAIYPLWEIISATYETNLDRYLEYLPRICLAGAENPHASPQLYDPKTLLRHFSECLLNEIVTNTAIPASFDKKISETIIGDCFSVTKAAGFLQTAAALEKYQQWQTWRQQLLGDQNISSFSLGFKLTEAPENNIEQWQITFILISKQDPSLRLELDEYWYAVPETRTSIRAHFGQDLDKNILLSLGYAARIYPPIWQGLETDKPTGFSLNLTEAFTFLKETAWILEDAGYKVIIPAWWTPEGRQRAKVRLKTTSKSGKSTPVSKGIFSLENIIEYQYELAIGEETISQEEWQQLINTKTPLVKFRGQWVELEQNKMQQMLDFWQKYQQENPEMNLIELMKKAAEYPEEIIVETDDFLGSMLEKLQNPSQLEPIENPPQLQGTLREYQKRGVAWIQYLEQLGLNGCLADDMGLGKTLQVIARLIGEREGDNNVLPTLLVAPTSVVGNWAKEIEKFAPHLQVLIHHGSKRYQDENEFQTVASQKDIVITSFTLVRKDLKLFNSQSWQRLVIDEAQNIKNPKAAQTKAILSLSAQHRLALTGTPVENRLLDLWSIFNFLNPGYLGKETQFRKAFEVPIQKQNDRLQSTVLKKLVEPFILRRVKTDKQIIKDLPDKVENKQYCNLTKEQASLYEVVIKEVEKQLEEAEGIKRKGLILSTLMRLKQICNHPRQFLQDNSAFTPERSHKLERLGEMLEEVILEGDSLLIFTQFTEIGDSLQKYLKQTFRYNTYYLHGGTSQPKREQMIEEFQHPETEPSVFILSLKAGGVGITLTKANHVFHFDRWWNPAVENQATDRAFRIGQQKNVFVHKFVTLGTLEERIDEMIEEKKKVANAIVSNDESWLTELDNESFRQLIALNKQTII